MTSAEVINPIDTNPLLQTWVGPYGGVPAFDKVKHHHFIPAIESGISSTLSATDAIAKNPAEPTFANTIVELERVNDRFSKSIMMYFIWASNLNDKAFQEIERQVQPKLAEFSNKILQNTSLFERIEKVYNSPEYKTLNDEQKRLTWITYNDLVRVGAKLPESEKAKLADINLQMADLFTKFNQNLLADENEKMVILEKPDDLKGLSQAQIDGAAAAATASNPGKWIIKNTRSFVDPFLTYSDRRDLREKVWKMFINRGDNGDKNDNNKIISQILDLRLDRANLLGYKTHAHWRLENSMAKTPENAMSLLDQVWTPAIARVYEEVKEMEDIAKSEGLTGELQPWDYHYYSEKVRKQKYDLDNSEVSEYLQLDKLREGLFFVAKEVFNLEFTPIDDVPVYHEDIKVWRVNDTKTKKLKGLWYFDPYAREGKRSGAWMNAYRDQSRIDGDVTTIVSNNSNFVKGKPGEPVLISWDDASTLFHEFGHALHGLSSDVTYPSLSGTNVFRDYVEFPSQLLEYWLATPEVLNKYALHYKTGKPLPKELADKIELSSTFKQGYNSTEFLASAIVDMQLHLAGKKNIDPDKFEKETLAAYKMPKYLVMRHRTPQFGHVFSGDGYSAGYYSYLWADVLTADAYSAFTEAGGPYDKAISEKLIQYIFSKGNTIDPAEAYRMFRGRDPKVEALMKTRGFK